MASQSNSPSRAALMAYLDLRDRDEGLLPAGPYLPYDAIESLSTARLSLIPGQVIEGELREMTNQVNQWQSRLRKWHAWNQVLADKPLDTRWEIEADWVRDIAFVAMFQPSAVRDRLTMVATNALHQIRMALDPTIPDTLVGDPKEPGRGPRNPSRAEKEAQLAGFAAQWTTGPAFMAALQGLDGDGNRAATSDFRNRASHAIAPHFTAGITQIVTRRKEQAIRWEGPEGGLHHPVPIPGKLATVYGYGGTEPLSMDAAWAANMQEFKMARAAFAAYLALLGEAAAALPRTT